MELIRLDFGATRDEIAQQVARRLGFKALGAQLRDVILRSLERAIERGQLVDHDGRLLLGKTGET